MRRVRPEGFEPSTLGSEDRCAIQLRHGRVFQIDPYCKEQTDLVEGGGTREATSLPPSISGLFLYEKPLDSSP